MCPHFSQTTIPAGMFGPKLMFWVSSAIKNVAKWGKRAMTIPAVSEMLTEAPEAKNALMKAINGQDLTVADWRHLGSFVRGLTGTHNITSSNRAARRALEKRGYDLSNQNSFLKKSGLWDTAKPTSQATVKVNIKGKEVEIPISTKSKEKLDTDLKKAGNDQAKKDAAIRKVEEVNQHITNEKLKPEDVTAIESSHLRNARFVPRSLATTKNNYGRIETENRPNQDTFDSYLNSDRGLWDRFLYGSNRNLKRYDPITNAIKPIATQETQKQPVVQNYKQNNKIYEMGRGPSQFDIKNYSPKAIKRDYKNIIEKQNFTNADVQEGTYSGLGITFKVTKDSRGHYTLTNDVPVSSNHPRMLFANLSKTGVKKKIAELVKQAKTSSTANKKSMSTKEVGIILRDLKRMGWLKQGGKITDNQIDNFLNQYK